jgi:hypothetical protein
MIENFKKIVTDKLTNAGLLVNERESIFSSDPMIQNESEEALMLVGPNKEAWVFIGGMMPEEEFNNSLENFVNLVKASTLENIKRRIDINQNISLKTYLEGLAKLLGGEAPTTKIGTMPLKDLIAQIYNAPEEPKEEK